MDLRISAPVTPDQYRKIVGDRPWWVENPTPELLNAVLPHLNPQQRASIEWGGGKVALLSTWTPFLTHVAEFTPATTGQPAVLYVTPYEPKNKLYFSTARFEEEAQAYASNNWIYEMAAD